MASANENTFVVVVVVAVAEGFGGLYHGLATNMIRTVPSCVITFATYEVVVNYLDQYMQTSDLA